jgi:hypothetical protein
MNKIKTALSTKFQASQYYLPFSLIWFNSSMKKNTEVTRHTKQQINRMVWFVV